MAYIDFGIYTSDVYIFVLFYDTDHSIIVLNIGETDTFKDLTNKGINKQLLDIWYNEGIPDGYATPFDLNENPKIMSTHSYLGQINDDMLRAEIKRFAINDVMKTRLKNQNRYY